MDNKQRLFQYLVENSFDAPPTVRELCAALSIKSTSTVYNLLHLLEEDGLISIAKGKRRNIALTNKARTVKVPLLGTVAAGTPILAQENIEMYITFEVEDGSGEYFALRVKGDSMIDAGILDGDIIVARRAQTAEDGEIVVALIEDEATVKRLFRANGLIELRAENSNFPAIYADAVSLLGRVVSVIRHYE